MEKNQILAICVVVIIMGAAGAVLILNEPIRTDVKMSITASGDNIEDVSWGSPETGFWGEENGAIDWKSLPLEWNKTNFNDNSRVYEYEFWFRERFYNGTQWNYDNHGPFFVDWPQLDYYREIELNKHVVYINISTYE